MLLPGSCIHILSTGRRSKLHSFQFDTRFHYLFLPLFTLNTCKQTLKMHIQSILSLSAILGVAAAQTTTVSLFLINFDDQSLVAFVAGAACGSVPCFSFCPRL